MKNWFKATGIVLGTLLGVAAFLAAMFAIVWFFGPMWLIAGMTLLTLIVAIVFQKGQLDAEEEPAEGGRRKE